MAQPEPLAVAASVDHRTDTELVELLNQLDVPFLAGGAPVGRSSSVTPSVLLARLAASPEARLRLAAIPLLLRHPELATRVHAALTKMPPSAVLNFKCYYAAAVLLQRKHWERLTPFVTPGVALPPRFFAELGVLPHDTPDEGLKWDAPHDAAIMQIP